MKRTQFNLVHIAVFILAFAICVHCASTTTNALPTTQTAATTSTAASTAASTGASTGPTTVGTGTTGAGASTQATETAEVATCAEATDCTFVSCCFNEVARYCGQCPSAEKISRDFKLYVTNTTMGPDCTLANCQDRKRVAFACPEGLVDCPLTLRCQNGICGVTGAATSLRSFTIVTCALLSLFSLLL